MGRLTLNALLFFALFERELSSERARDKDAASRRKGKWTGGTVPLGDRGADDFNIRLPWSSAANRPPISFDDSESTDSKEPDPKMVQTIVRALRWADALINDSYASVEELAIAANLHPKVIRNELKLAYLAPEIVKAVLSGRRNSSLADLRGVSALSWRRQVQELSRSRCSSAG
jgi:hypothetical protein